MVLEGKRAARRSQIVRDVLTIFRGLQLYPSEYSALSLGLNDSDGCAVNEQEIVGFPVTGLERELANSDAAGSRQIGGALILDNPTSIGQQLVDVLPGAIFRSNWHANRRLYPVLQFANGFGH